MHVSIAPHGEVAGSAVGGPLTTETITTPATATTGPTGMTVAIDYDRIRATLMVMGIALHAADVFVSAGDWLVADTHRGAVFDALVALIHSFRVPGFFLLSQSCKNIPVFFKDGGRDGEFKTHKDMAEVSQLSHSTRCFESIGG